MGVDEIAIHDDITSWDVWEMREISLPIYGIIRVIDYDPTHQTKRYYQLSPSLAMINKFLYS